MFNDTAVNNQCVAATVWLHVLTFFMLRQNTATLSAACICSSDYYYKHFCFHHSLATHITCCVCRTHGHWACELQPV